MRRQKGGGVERVGANEALSLWDVISSDLCGAHASSPEIQARSSSSDCISIVMSGLKLFALLRMNPPKGQADAASNSMQGAYQVESDSWKRMLGPTMHRVPSRTADKHHRSAHIWHPLSLARDMPSIVSPPPQPLRVSNILPAWHSGCMMNFIGKASNAHLAFSSFRVQYGRGHTKLDLLNLCKESVRPVQQEKL